MYKWRSHQESSISLGNRLLTLLYKPDVWIDAPCNQRLSAGLGRLARPCMTSFMFTSPWYHLLCWLASSPHALSGLIQAHFHRHFQNPRSRPLYSPLPHSKPPGTPAACQNGCPTFYKLDQKPSISGSWDVLFFKDKFSQCSRGLSQA